MKYQARGRRRWLQTVAGSALLTCLVLSGCEEKTPAQLRSAQLAQSDGEVVLGLAWPLNSLKGTLQNGVQMAVSELNAKGGVLHGKLLKLVVKDDESSLVRGRLVAQELANDPQISAVIGHLNTYVALPAAQIYERAGIVMLTPGASGQKVTDGDSALVFRSLPGNRDQGRQIADYAQAQGYRRVVIYYIKNDYGVDLANFFEQRANELGLHVLDRRSYNKEGEQHMAIFNDWAAFLQFDAVFFAGSLPEGAQIIRDMRRAGIKAPIFAGVGLDSPELIKLGGRDVERTVVFSLFDPDSTRPDVSSFVERYRRQYGNKPDSHAAQGYDAVYLLAQAINQAGSRDPVRIARALHGIRNWQGVTGSHSFSEKGDMVGKRLYKSEVRNGAFVFESRARDIGSDVRATGTVMVDE